MANVETLQCTVCGEPYNYDDKDSPEWASVFCGINCRDSGLKMQDDEDEDFEEFEPEDSDD